MRVRKPLPDVPYRGLDVLLLRLLGGVELLEALREEHAREVQHVEGRREVVVVLLLLVVVVAVLLRLLAGGG